MSGPGGDAAAFICANTTIAEPPFVPELRLYLATEVTPLWQATEKRLQDAQLPPPFWAFAWAGGQALARYLLDNPEVVAGRSVLDVGSGSGLCAIAAAKAGAAQVTAVDIDPIAAAAIGLNAALNGVTIAVATRDVTAQPQTAADIVIAGDICYERAAADRLAAWLRKAAAVGRTVLLADPGRTYLPKHGLERLARYDVPTTLELEDRTMRQTGVWRMVG